MQRPLNKTKFCPPRVVSQVNFSSGRRREIFEELSSVPKNVTRWLGETTLCQLTLNPRECSKLIRVTSPRWHSAWVFPMIRITLNWGTVNTNVLVATWLWIGATDWVVKGVDRPSTNPTNAWYGYDLCSLVFCRLDFYSFALTSVSFKDLPFL